MKYSELISFNPIEDVIQLTTSNDADKARSYVKSYVMSDTMAESIQKCSCQNVDCKARRSEFSARNCHEN